MMQDLTKRDIEILKYLKTHFVFDENQVGPQPEDVLVGPKVSLQGNKVKSRRSPSSQPYWNDWVSLDLYDKTFAQRILWKWAAVGREWNRRNFRLPGAVNHLIDVGCGSGIASRFVLDFFGKDHFKKVDLLDSSQLALDFAHQKLEQLGAKNIRKLSTRVLKENVTSSSLVVMSHCLTEMTQEDLVTLSDEVSEAAAIIVVEPGTPQGSEHLRVFWRALQGDFKIEMPCPSLVTQCPLSACPAKRKDIEQWCHFYTNPPVEVFQSAFWSQFSKELKVDLRSLTFSCLTLVAKKSGEALEVDSTSSAKVPRPQDRVLGRPLGNGKHTKVFVCGANGVETRLFPTGKNKKRIKELAKDPFLSGFDGVLLQE